jgi:hypothetical protein
MTELFKENLRIALPDNDRLAFWAFIKERPPFNLDEIKCLESMDKFNCRMDAWIHRLYVPVGLRKGKNHAGVHIGSAMIEAFEDICRRRDVRRIGAHLQTDNPDDEAAALHFFKKRDYQLKTIFPRTEKSFMFMYKDLV